MFKDILDTKGICLEYWALRTVLPFTLLIFISCTVIDLILSIWARLEKANLIWLKSESCVPASFAVATKFLCIEEYYR